MVPAIPRKRHRSPTTQETAGQTGGKRKRGQETHSSTPPARAERVWLHERQMGRKRHCKTTRKRRRTALFPERALHAPRPRLKTQETKASSSWLNQEELFQEEANSGLQAHSGSTFKKRIAVVFQDEKWVDLLPKIEAVWAMPGTPLSVPTLGYTKRKNFFISMFWPSKKIVWNSFDRRRNEEFRRHLSNVVAHAKRQGLKKIIFFMDYASYHQTSEVEKFFEAHPLFKAKMLGKKDPNSNPVEGLVNKRLNSAVGVNH